MRLRGSSCEEIGKCTSQLPTTSQHDCGIIKLVSQPIECQHMYASTRTRERESGTRHGRRRQSVTYCEL